MKKITIADSVTSIGENAFSSCNALASVSIPSKVTSIGASAFSSCSALKSMTIPNSVTSIGAYAFENCSGLTGSMAIPASVTSIGRGAFNSTKISSFDVDTGNSKFASQDGVLFTKDMKTLVAYPAGKTGAYDIPGGVTSIEAYAFYNCSNLTGVTMLYGLKEIGDHAFDSCKGLTSVEIPSNAKIGGYAFRGCSSLRSAKINPGVSNIADNAFMNCSSLTSVYIPESVSSISGATFDGCNGLQDVYYGGSKKQWERVTIFSSNAPLSKATIHYAKFDVVVTADPPEGGTVTGGGAFSPNYPCTVTATAHEGYIFEAWTNTDGTPVSTDAKYTVAVDQDLEFLAKFVVSAPVTYTVDFDSKGGSAVESQNVLDGKLAEKPDVPTREGHAFGGWYQEETYATPWNFDIDTVTKNITLYARWTPISYPVIFDLNSTGATGSFPETLVAYGQKIPVPITNPDWVDHTFEGWYREPECINIWDFDRDIVRGDTILYAKWTEETPPAPSSCTVTFDLNYSGAPAPATTQVTSGGKISKPADPSRSSYDFSGWYKEAACTTVWNFDTDTVTGNTTLYAKWTEKTPSTPSYTITFDPNNGESGPFHTMTTKSDGTLAGLPDGPTPPSGYTFTGWYDARSGGTQISTSWKFDRDTTVYANWKKTGDPVTTCTVTFDPNGGTGGDTLTTGTDGRLTALPGNPTRDGYTFDAWYTAQSGGTKVSTATVFMENTTVYAHWTANGNPPGQDESGTFTVTFDPNGGTGGGTLTTGTDGRLTALPGNPTRDGYIFDAWYTAQSGGTKVSTATVFTKNITVYAHWTADGNPPGPDEPGTFTVTFDPNGGTGGGTLTTDTDGRLTALPANPVRSGYSFDGWYTAQSGGTKVSTATVFTENTTVYARWNQNTAPAARYWIYTPSRTPGGSFSVSHTSAAEGARVTIELSPRSNYELDWLSVTNLATGQEVRLTRGYSDEYTFTMPASDVEVEITFAARYTGGSSGGNSGGAYYVPDSAPASTRPIRWYYSKGAIYHVTDGLVPAGTWLTRDMLVSVLYNLDSTSSGEPEFWATNHAIVPDIYQSWLWGIDKPTSREQTVVILFSYAQYKNYNTFERVSLTGYTDYGQIRPIAQPAMS